MMNDGVQFQFFGWLPEMGALKMHNFYIGPKNNIIINNIILTKKINN